MQRSRGITRSLNPSVDKKGILVMAGDHGIAESGTSAYPQSVTGEMVKTFLRGGAGINVLSRQIGAHVVVVDMGIIPDISEESTEESKLIVKKVGKGTRDFSKGPAMSRDQAELPVLTGYELAYELFSKGMELLGAGDMGIGNTTSASAIGAVITGESVGSQTPSRPEYATWRRYRRSTSHVSD